MGPPTWMFDDSYRMTKDISFSNQQDKFPFNESSLKSVIHYFLNECIQANSWELSIAFLKSDEIAEWNRSHLQHDGPADVLTYDYLEDPTLDKKLYIEGEILICPDVASEVSQEYKVTWQNEVVRYVIHGILHLMGFDDLDEENRKIMKERENHWMSVLETTFALEDISSV